MSQNSVERDWLILDNKIPINAQETASVQWTVNQLVRIIDYSINVGIDETELWDTTGEERSKIYARQIEQRKRNWEVELIKNAPWMVIDDVDGLAVLHINFPYNKWWDTLAILNQISANLGGSFSVRKKLRIVN